MPFAAAATEHGLVFLQSRKKQPCGESGRIGVQVTRLSRGRLSCTHRGWIDMEMTPPLRQNAEGLKEGRATPTVTAGCGIVIRAARVRVETTRNNM